MSVVGRSRSVHETLKPSRRAAAERRSSHGAPRFAVRPQRVLPEPRNPSTSTAHFALGHDDLAGLGTLGQRATGAPRKRSTSSGARGGTATPRRRSSAIACSSSGPSTRQGSIRATGRPRCVINTASPRRTSLSNPLSPFFASLTLIWKGLCQVGVPVGSYGRGRKSPEVRFDGESY